MHPNQPQTNDCLTHEEVQIWGNFNGNKPERGNNAMLLPKSGNLFSKIDPQFGNLFLKKEENENEKENFMNQNQNKNKETLFGLNANYNQPPPGNNQPKKEIDREKQNIMIGSKKVDERKTLKQSEINKSQDSVQTSQLIEQHYQYLPRCEEHGNKPGKQSEIVMGAQQDHKKLQFQCKQHKNTLDYVCIDPKCEKQMIFCGDCLAINNQHYECQKTKSIQKAQEFLNKFYTKRQMKDCGKCLAILEKLKSRLEDEKNLQMKEIEEKQQSLTEIEKVIEYVNNPQKDFNQKEKLHQQHLDELYSVKDVQKYEEVLRKIRKSLDSYPFVISYHGQIENVKEVIYPELRHQKVQKMVINEIDQIYYIRENVLKLQVNLRYFRSYFNQFIKRRKLN